MITEESTGTGNSMKGNVKRNEDSDYLTTVNDNGNGEEDDSGG